jgi:hypothetical protein
MKKKLVSNVIVSKEVAKELRTNKNTALVPISATDLIWEESMKECTYKINLSFKSGLTEEEVHNILTMLYRDFRDIKIEIQQLDPDWNINEALKVLAKDNKCIKEALENGDVFDLENEWDDYLDTLEDGMSDNPSDYFPEAETDQEKFELLPEWQIQRWAGKD